MLDGLLLVSLPKSGTHLVAEWLVAHGYVEVGVARVDEARRAERIRRVLERAAFRRLREFTFLSHDVLASCIQSEMLRRVLPVWGEALHPAQSLIQLPLVAQALAPLTNEELFANGLAVITHGLWFDEEVAPAFLESWSKSLRPRILFNYRDPRDQLLSMVHFLRDSSIAGPFGSVYGPILRSITTLDDQISFAIRCQTFPFRNVYRRNAWMLYHPDVLKLRFEDFVGPRGGGSDTRQSATVASLARHIGVHPLPGTLDQLFGRSRTFRQGRIGAWRKEFSEQNRKDFDREFVDVLAMYNYAED